MSKTESKAVMFKAPKLFLEDFDEWWPDQYNTRTDAILTAMRRLKKSDNVSVCHGCLQRHRVYGVMIMKSAPVEGQRQVTEKVPICKSCFKCYEREPKLYQLERV